MLDAPDRAKMPTLHGKEVDWDTALRYFCDKMREILDKHGPEAAAFLSTGQIMFEEMAFLGALAKFGMGMIHGDGNTCQCMATAVTAYKESFGFDAAQSRPASTAPRATGSPRRRAQPRAPPLI